MPAAPEARFVLRQRGVLESADLALRLLVLHARAFGWLTLAVCVPGFVLTLVLRYVLYLDASVVWCVALALAAWCEGPFTSLAGAIAMDRDATARSAIQAFRPYAVSYLWHRSLALAAEALASVAFVAPWLFAAPSLLFVPEVVLLERASHGVFARSARVIATASARAFQTVMLLLLSRALGMALFDAVMRRSLGLVLDVHARVESLFEEGISPYALAGLWLAVPVTAMVRYVAYADLRTLREGWDVQRRFQLLAARLEASET